jgi:hypothetical protein
MLALFLVACLAPQDDAAATEAITTYDSVISKSKDPSARIAAVNALAKVQHEKVVGRLGAQLTHDEKDLRIAAAHALKTFSELPDLKKSASHAVASAINSGSNQKEVEVEVALFSTLGHLQEESSGTVIKTHFDDKELAIAQAAIAAAGDLKSKAMFEPLLEELRDCEKKLQTNDSSGNYSRSKPMKSSSKGGGGEPPPDPEAQKRMRAQSLQPATNGALAVLTGQNFATSSDWQNWWSKNRASFTPSK